MFFKPAVVLPALALLVACKEDPPETDPVFTTSDASSVSADRMANWDSAYTWGDHAEAGYLTSESDPMYAESVAAGITADDLAAWDEANRWGNHADFGYLSIEEDPEFATSPAADITAEDLTAWDAAASWGNHAEAGYLTAMPTDVDAESTRTYDAADPTIPGASHALYAGTWTGGTGTGVSRPIYSVPARSTALLDVTLLAHDLAENASRKVARRELMVYRVGDAAPVVLPLTTYYDVGMGDTLNAAIEADGNDVVVTLNKASGGVAEVVYQFDVTVRANR